MKFLKLWQGYKRNKINVKMNVNTRKIPFKYITLNSTTKNHYIRQSDKICFLTRKFKTNINSYKLSRHAFTKNLTFNKMNTHTKF